LKKTAKIFISLTIVYVIFLSLPVPKSFNIGTGDFRPYWSASYLLRQGQDFSDPVLMDEIERSQTGWNKSFTMMAWFAPTGMVILLPFTLLPFEKAAFLWLLLNILVLSITAFLLWEKGIQKIWIPLLAVFTFPMTLLSLYVGQINTLVLFGLAIYLSLEKNSHQYIRGIGLALTTIKPHLVILTLPLIIIDSVYRKQWKTLIGFFGALLFSAIVLFAFYPTWISSFWSLISSGMSTLRETPTISGLIVYISGQSWGKWLWIPAVVIFLTIWWFYKENLNRKRLIYISIPLSLLLSPIGWGYDQLLLLIPLMFVFQLIKNEDLSKGVSSIIIFSVSLIYGIILLLRILSPNEVWFFWVPILLLLLFFNLKHQNDHYATQYHQ